jgi:hypothetical protein
MHIEVNGKHKSMAKSSNCNESFSPEMENSAKTSQVIEIIIVRKPRRSTAKLQNPRELQSCS